MYFNRHLLLHNAYPNERWWLKADGTDIQEGQPRCSVNWLRRQKSYF